MLKRNRIMCLTAVMCTLAVVSVPASAGDIPVLNGNCWRIAENSPDVDPYNNYPDHNACDFAIFPAENGQWQLISCIRYTSYPGGTRLFYRWTSDDPLAENWTPEGIFMTTDMSIHTKEGTLQAPHAFKEQDTYWFFYNNAGAYAMTSPDGLNWSHATDHQGNYKFFDMGRDVMIFDDRDGVTGDWIAYYTDNGVEARRADDLMGPWSSKWQVTSAGNPESPFVVRRDGTYYRWGQMSVWTSDDPTDFPDGAPATKLGPKPGYIPKSSKYAPEILEIDGKWYVTGYNKGLWMAEMKWVPENRPTLVKYDFEGSSLAAQTADGVSASDFSTSATRTNFQGIFDGYAWGGRDFYGADESEAVANGDCFEFTVSTDDQPLDLTLLSLFATRQSSAATHWALRTSLDGFTETIDSAEVKGDGTWFIELDDLPEVTDEVTFRIYAWGQTGNNRIWLDDVTLDGVVVPEPATIGLLGAGLIGLLRRR